MNQILEDKNLRKTLIAGAVGNILEWYDFALYGYLAPIIAKLFFPSHDPTISLLQTFGVFAVGFFARPVGSLIFGHIGDKYGRKKALALSVILMAISTTLIGLLPTYSQIGILATILLTMLRVLQGLSVGGEYTTSVAFLIEHSASGKRGFYGSFALFGAVLGIMLGSATGAVITSFMSEESLYSIGWRLAFFVGIPLGILGYFIRRKIEETPNFKEIEEAEEIAKFPILEILKTDYIDFFKSFGLSILQAVAFHLLFVYLTTFYNKVLNIPMSQSLIINTISMIILVIFIPVFAYLSDIFGRKKVLMLSIVLIILLSYPLFKLILTGNIFYVLIAQSLFAVITSGFMGTLPTALVELFPTKIRNTAYSVSYNLALAIFGGTTPLVATYIIKVSSNPIAISFYLIAIAIMAFVITLTLKETAFEKLKH
ncbi:MHS family MFS transporter [Venenivibrio stagnispumantis]|uniref:MFS transporter, MHS family, proline/betaine transporter n=1 Tax=Venenivibrio stagnispumantis TaxID=407998 RepID=A0AA45WPZ0_9AQUI|nr:MFS transporter [Venenivibrio stagnispumantis]MCW4572712.1 MFS transporter [Venenivibrio stagnispumantis]SMP22816.1 MFS transporter, MHS family, proline/betaine transporter [Venenivibrio stagnispumantis]